MITPRYWCSYIFKGKKIHVSDLKKVLGRMGIELTDEELIKLQETLPIDGELFSFTKAF